MRSFTRSSNRLSGIDSITCDLTDNLVGNNPGKNFGKLQGAQDRRTTKDKKRKFPRIIETDTQN